MLRYCDFWMWMLNLQERLSLITEFHRIFFFYTRKHFCFGHFLPLCLDTHSLLPSPGCLPLQLRQTHHTHSLIPFYSRRLCLRSSLSMLSVCCYSRTMNKHTHNRLSERQSCSELLQVEKTSLSSMQEGHAKHAPGKALVVCVLCWWGTIMVTIKLLQPHLHSATGQLSGGRAVLNEVDDTSRVAVGTAWGDEVNRLCVSLSLINKSLAPN